MTPSRWKTAKKGFTLIELLIVVAIILILMATFTASTLGARQKARKVKAEAEVRELVNAIRLYDMALGDLPTTLRPGTTVEATHDVLKPLIDPAANPVNSVFFNIDVAGDSAFLDPWGNPYRIYVRRENPQATEDVYETAVFLPGARQWADAQNEIK